MTSLAADELRMIAASIAANGFLRRPLQRTGHREWLHFCVHGADLTLIVNFSIVNDLRSSGPGPRDRARLLVLVRDTTGWDGDVDDIDISAAHLPGGQLLIRFPGGVIELADHTFRVTGRLRQRPVSFELALTPASFPSQACNVSIGGGAPINWLVVPRLVARGSVTCGARTWIVDGAPAYHDHNWGTFSHRDLAWTWGHASSSDGKRDVVFARLLDQPQATVYMQALMVWRDGRQERVFRADDLEALPEGWLRPQRTPTVPRAASLLATGTATEVPRRFHLVARGDGDHLTGHFEAKDVARIAVPHDHDLGTTFIHEVVGQLSLAGSIRDELVAIDGPAVFEFLRSVA